MNKPDILIVTATLGNRSTLKRTINSVSNIGKDRTYHVIIAPPVHCFRLRNEFPNVNVIEEPETCKGIYSALNYGLKKYAKDFKYLTYINDDDYWLDNFVKLFEIMDSNPNVDVAYGKTCYVDENNEVIGEQTSSSRYKAFKPLLLNRIVLFTQQATIMKSDLFLRIGGYDESYKLIADTNFWIKSIESKAVFYYVNSICAAYTIQSGQLSSDGTLQNEEHVRLGLAYNYRYSLIPFFEKLIFRITNFRIYVRRILKYKKISRMGGFFHNS
ncbi:Glycosyltransferase, GT2 family [Polaribacter sp. KT25b]|uniref:glycosyltransferase n=1 Tax=Polaribacter sp. KT25b TaxID=1855336 RepID=UPI00087C36A2|nr:glycosyltransferase [Polaribacter sp. KT25b]SDS26498.1 Glycosyltransferase, GT2 family [Polaribacter sp. KT25b]